MTNGHVAPKEDGHADWNVSNIIESNGTTTIERYPLYINNSLHLVQKYVLMFVCGHY